MSPFKKLFVRSAKIVLAVEVTSFVVSFGIWYKLNHSQDFRLKTYRNCNWLLEAYYKFGEELSAENKVIRINDLETWKANGEI